MRWCLAKMSVVRPSVMRLWLTQHAANYAPPCQRRVRLNQPSTFFPPVRGAVWTRNIFIRWRLSSLSCTDLYCAFWEQQCACVTLFRESTTILCFFFLIIGIIWVIDLQSFQWKNNCLDKMSTITTSNIRHADVIKRDLQLTLQFLMHDFGTLKLKT